MITRLPRKERNQYQALYLYDLTHGLLEKDKKLKI